MEVPSSSKARDGDEELELEDVWLDLHALRKLYGLLQKSSAKIPHGQCQDGLDDKSRLLLKNLLDDATQKALQSQAQSIVSCSHDPPPSEGTKLNPSSHENIRKESQSPENLQKCHPAAVEETHGPLVQQTPPSLRSNEVGISQIEPKRCPHCDLKRLESAISMPRTPDGTARHHRQTHHEPDRVSIDRSSKATKNIHHPSAEHGMRDTSEPESRGKTRQSRTPAGGTRLADVSTRRTMSQKRSRRVDAESTRMKGSRPESLARTSSTKDGRPKRNCLPDRTAQIHQPEKRRETSPSIKKDRVPRQLSERRLARTEKAPSRRGSLSRKERAKQVGQDQELSMRSVHRLMGPRGRIRPPRTLRRESMVYSSLSGTTRSVSSTSEESAGPPTAGEIVPRRMPSRHAIVPSRDWSSPKRVPPPRRRLSHHRTMRPSRGPEQTTKAGPEKKPEKRDGRLRRFKEKLAIIFHHHHHHHHHQQHRHVDGNDAGNDGGDHHRRSPSKHAGRILHHTSEEEQGKLVMEMAAERAVAGAPAQHQHGYLRQLLGALVRHVWRSRKRKAVRADRGQLGRSARSASRVRVKKLHWWQRFRRRGGVKLANGKKPRLRLGLSKTNPRTTKS